MAEAGIGRRPKKLERHHWRIVPRLVREFDLVQLVRVFIVARTGSALAKTKSNDARFLGCAVDRDLRADHLASALGVLLCDDLRDDASGAVVRAAQASVGDGNFHHRAISHRAIMGRHGRQRKSGAPDGEQNGRDGVARHCFAR